jgi:hypothetical protein
MRRALVNRQETLIFVLVLLSAVAACGGGQGMNASPPNGPGISSPYPFDPVLRLNSVQAKGTHNSYHEIPPIVFDPSHRFTHQPLDVQLREQGVRQFELDLYFHADEGFQVFHIPLVDQETTCRRFTECMNQIRQWSDENPWHMPVLVWLEPKDDAEIFFPNLLPVREHYRELEDEILSVWPRERILTPDEVRGRHETLPEAIREEGWPTLGDLRGRMIFSLLDSGENREAYTRESPVLRGRLLFVDASESTDPYAAMFKVNNARADREEVLALVEAGFIITSNVDGPENSDEENRDRLEASLAAGAHYLSSDFPAPVPERNYWFQMPGGRPARCNPVYGPEECSAEDIENLNP